MLVVSVTGKAWDGPKDWQVADEADEQLVRYCLTRLDAFKVDHDDAFLLATDAEGPVGLGSWTNDGARQLARDLDSARSPGLQQIRRELRQTVSSG
jgi:hypothetical protein